MSAGGRLHSTDMRTRDEKTYIDDFHCGTCACDVGRTGSGAKVGWALSILRPDIAPGLDSDRIALTQPDGTFPKGATAWKA